MKAITKHVLIGLSILLPVLISVQLVVWVVRTLESWLRSLFLMLLPESLYFPGAGILTFILIALVIGVTSHNTITKRIWKLPGRLMERIPLVANIYGTIKDFLDLMSGSPFDDSAVVWVTMPEMNGKLLGIVTKKGDDKKSRLSKMMGDDDVAVFLPMSYQAGGYMIVVPKSQVEKADLDAGEALQLIMSAGLGARSAT